MRAGARVGLKLVALAGLSVLALQLALVTRIAMLAWFDPASTAMQRSEIRRLALEQGRVVWSWRWVDENRMSAHLGRAVIASEDAGFVSHSGVDWEAMERAWKHNQHRERLAARPGIAAHVASLRGGSTITQQLVKNLLLSGERTVWRKAQELMLALLLEVLLDKRRILLLYLNHVEWGQGLFGAQAAARHYFGVDATRLNAAQAARLAVMLPAPKRFERQPSSEYLLSRSAVVRLRMDSVQVP